MLAASVLQAGEDVTAPDSACVGLLIGEGLWAPRGQRLRSVAGGKASCTLHGHASKLGTLCSGRFIIGGTNS